MLDQPPAQYRPHCSSDRSKARPCADRLSPALLVKRCADNRKAPRHKQRSTNALDASGKNQLVHVRGSPAARRCHRKNCHAQHKDQPPAKQVAKRAANQNQCPQNEPIKLNHPLHIHDRCMKAGLQSRQSDIHHCTVDKSHAGADNRGSEDPRPRLRGTGRVWTPGPDYSFIAR